MSEKELYLMSIGKFKTILRTFEALIHQKTDPTITPKTIYQIIHVMTNTLCAFCEDTKKENDNFIHDCRICRIDKNICNPTSVETKPQTEKIHECTRRPPENPGNNEYMIRELNKIIEMLKSHI